MTLIVMGSMNNGTPLGLSWVLKAKWPCSTSYQGSVPMKPPNTAHTMRKIPIRNPYRSVQRAALVVSGAEHQGPDECAQSHHQSLCQQCEVIGFVVAEMRGDKSL